MIPPSPLDNPDNASHAWARFLWLMRLMGGITAAMIVVACALLYRSFGLVSVHLYIAAVLGIALTMMLGAGLMGLVFLSSGTGHDESIIDPLADDQDADGHSG